jgi:hypothetical protein
MWLFFKKVEIVSQNCLNGLYQLLADPAGVICLLSLAIVTMLALDKRIGDVAIAACFTMIPAVAAMLKHKAFNGGSIDQPVPSLSETIESVVIKNTLPPKGQ